MAKKAAILIPGLPRWYEHTIESLRENVIESNPEFEFDIFLSLWNATNDRKDRENSLTFLDKTYIDQVIEAYNPKSHIIMNYEKMEKKFSDINYPRYEKYIKDIEHEVYKGKDFCLHALFMQFWGCLKAGELLERHYENYDVVIKWRYDLLAKSPLQLNKFIEHENYDSSIFGVANDHHGIVDFMFIGNQENMKIPMNVFNFVNNLEHGGPKAEIESFTDTDDTILKRYKTTIPEYIWFEYIQKCNKKIVPIPVEWNLHGSLVNSHGNDRHPHTF